MVVIIFGATGMVGKQLITHALAKKWNVRAFGRHAETLYSKEEYTENFTAIKGFMFDQKDVLAAIEGADGVLSALGGSFDGVDKARSLGMKNIIKAMQEAQVHRIVALGGVGVLQDAEGEFLMDAEDYPPQYIPVGLEHKQAYEYLKESGLDWTFVASPNILDKDVDSDFTTNAEVPAGGEINAGNLAMFMVNELEKNEYVRQRVGIGNNG